jgi:hypothetical protein
MLCDSPEYSNAEILDHEPIRLLSPLKSKGRRLLMYVIDVPGLSQFAEYNGMPPPRAMECGR